MGGILKEGRSFWDCRVEEVVECSRDVSCGAINSTDDWTDLMRIFVYLLQEVEYLGAYRVGGKE